LKLKYTNSITNWVLTTAEAIKKITIYNQPEHAAGRHLLSVVQGATNNWASLYSA